MEIVFDVRKTADENASSFFEASKKAKKKLAGAEMAVGKTRLQLQSLLKKQELEGVENKERPGKKQERKWYEKFRWFVSSEGFLCIGGRDAASNEILVKKHAEKGDIVFHTEISGSPFFVIKADGREIGQATLEEAGVATASFSRVWKLGLSHAEVFHVKPEQLSKTPKAGEYLEKGSFIVNGHANKQMAEVKLAVGAAKDGTIMCGPVAAVRKNCSRYLEIGHGNNKTSDVAKKIKKKLGGEIDDIARALPSGGVMLTHV